MKVGDVVKVEVPGEQPKHGHVVKVDDQDMHVLVCFHAPEMAERDFERLTREMVPA